MLFLTIYEENISLEAQGTIIGCHSRTQQRFRTGPEGIMYHILLDVLFFTVNITSGFEQIFH